jgi:sigma-B regulation protein RsbU (phosphoserine phosphatase)
MLDIQDRTITYVNAGHNSPILLRNQKQVLLQQGGPILGVLQNASYEEGEVQLLPGDLVVLYTDGITEAERNYGEYFGVERLLKLAQASMSKNPSELVGKVLEEVAKFSGNSPQSDDRTIIICQCYDKNKME